MGLDWCLDEPCGAISAPKLIGRGREEVMKVVDEQRSWCRGLIVEAVGEQRARLEDFLVKPDDELLIEVGDRYDCDCCPALKHFNDMGHNVPSVITRPCGFRGKWIGHMPGLPDWLQCQAYYDMRPDQMAEYASYLEEHTADVSTDLWPHLEAAIEWLKYWAGAGVSMYAWA